MEAIYKSAWSSIQFPSTLMQANGIDVRIKTRTLRYPRQIVKHSRFLKNLEVWPVFPPEPVIIDLENQENNESPGDDDEDDE